MSNNIEVQVDMISENDTHYFRAGGMSVWGNCQSIPLTPETLLKCGFIADNYGVFEIVRDNKPYVSGCDILLWIKQCVVKNKKVWNVCYGKELDTINELCNINHLHQLQNLYFALTGEELIYAP